jgi:hypothetical protein
MNPIFLCDLCVRCGQIFGQLPIVSTDQRSSAPICGHSFSPATFHGNASLPLDAA